MSGETNPWTTLHVEQRYRNHFIDVEEHTVRDAAGRERPYGVVRYRHRGLVIVPIHDDGHVTLIGQWRYAAGAHSWEIPAGSGAAGEAPLAAAKRELEEEAGLVAEGWLELAELTMSPAITDERARCFAAWKLCQREQHGDPQEVLKAKQVPFATAVEMALSGQITSAAAVVAILALSMRAASGDLPEELVHRLR